MNFPLADTEFRGQNCANDLDFYQIKRMKQLYEKSFTSEMLLESEPKQPVSPADRSEPDCNKHRWTRVNGYLSILICVLGFLATGV